MANVQNLLTMQQVDAFTEFATLQGATVRAGKGDYQKCQVQFAGHWNAICFSSKGNISTPETLTPLIKAFHALQLSKANGYAMPCYIVEKTPAPAPDVPMIEAAAIIERGTAHSSAELYAADLRDDVALRLYTEILPPHDFDKPATDFLLANMAKEAYRRADFLLAAGGHA